MYRYRGGVTAILFVAIVFLQPALAQAEQVFEQKNSQKITIEPALQEVVIDQEQRKTVPIVLENTTSVGQRYTIRLVDFGSLDESGGVAFLGSGDPRDYQDATWMEAGVNDIVVAPGSKSQLDVTIKNDDNFSPGGHYGAVLFERAALEGDAPGDVTEVAINQVFSALIYVRKIGGEIFALSLVNHDYRKSFWRLPEMVTLRFENTGNVHAVPRGTVRISDPLGRTVSRATINETSGLVLPQSKRVLSDRFRSLAFAWLPGHYSVRTEYRYDGKDDFEVVGEKYWYFPPVTVLLLVAIIASTLGIKKRYHQKKKK